MLQQEFGRLRIFEQATGPTGDVAWHERAAINECERTFQLYIPVDEPAIEGKRKRRRRTWLEFDVWRSLWIYGGRHSEKWSLSLPTLEPGSIRVTYMKDDELAHAATKRVWKAINRVGTKRVTHRYPRPGEESDREIGSDKVYGFHALEWCSRDPDRVLNGRIRPIGDFRAPQISWYRELREEVIRRYGDTLDDPGPPEIIERGAYASISHGRIWRHLI